MDEALRLLFKLVNEDTHHDFNLVLFLREDLNQGEVLVAESKPEEPVLVARTFSEGELGLERFLRRISFAQVNYVETQVRKSDDNSFNLALALRPVEEGVKAEVKEPYFISSKPEYFTRIWSELNENRFTFPKESRMRT